MAALMAESNKALGDADKLKKGAAKVRRKSKDLEEQLGGLESQFAAASDEWNKLGTNVRRQSRDYSDTDLLQAFKVVDADANGSIDRSELAKAIKAVDPGVSEETIDSMVKFADANEDGKVSLVEFKKIMLYKKDDKKDSADS